MYRIVSIPIVMLSSGPDSLLPEATAYLDKKKNKEERKQDIINMKFSMSVKQHIINTTFSMSVRSRLFSMILTERAEFCVWAWGV